MSIFTKRGNVFTLTEPIDEDTVFHQLVKGIYIPYFNPENGHTALVYQGSEPFEVDQSKRYGKFNHYKDALKRNVIKRKNTITGCLAIGRKGSGKSLLGKDLANELMKEENYLVILINKPFPMEVLSKILSSIKQPYMVFFDELGKIYTSFNDRQISTDGELGKFLILTSNESLKGAFFYITSNSFDNLDLRAMTSRPSRFLFNLDMEHLEVSSAYDIIKEANMSKELKYFLLKEIFNFPPLRLADGFNSDVLKHIVTMCDMKTTIDDYRDITRLYNLPRARNLPFRIIPQDKAYQVTVDRILGDYKVNVILSQSAIDHLFFGETKPKLKSSDKLVPTRLTLSFNLPDVIQSYLDNKDFTFQVKDSAGKDVYLLLALTDSYNHRHTEGIYPRFKGGTMDEIITHNTEEVSKRN